MRGGSLLPGCSPPRSSPTLESRLSRSRRGALEPATRTCTRRSSGCSATSAARSTPAARGTTRSRRRSGSTSPTPAPRRVGAIDAFARTVLDRAEEEAETLMPGYTHLQRAQPVTVGHHLLAWVEMLDRDRARFALRCRARRADPARRRRARRLDARAAAADGMRNSLDAVADRDFALDYLYAARCSSSTCRGSARSSCSGRRRSSASCGCPRTRRRARR